MLKTCEQCGVPIPEKRRFCGLTCISRFALFTRWKDRVTVGATDGRSCKRCGVQLVRKKFQNCVEMTSKFRGRKFCGNICARLHVARERRVDGGLIDEHGYIWIERPDCCDLHRGLRKIQEHVMKAEHVLGRKMKTAKRASGDDEAVHHIDGNKGNNANNNLLICTNSYHRWLHSRMSFLYQQEKFGVRA